ncbi:TolC family protein [Halioxenophilus sp. WMMB6]|uniref:TolC family protein n=1 Tax=Halioxenophilus sp. WMMB6 TaxID=3073815 RepID=UPI00295E9E7D|nr:TolC family protein [Halioxenophilus sp. WMMB6]
MNKFLLGILSLSLSLAGCAVLGPDTDYTAQADQAQLAVSGQAAGDKEPVAANTLLNQLLPSAELDSLLQQAYVANPSLQQMQLALQISQAQWRQANGGRLPSAALTVDASKAEGGEASYAAAFNISWQIDLWRTLSDRSQAAAKSVEQQAWLYQAAEDSLAAQVMQSWLLLINLQQTIAIGEQRIATLASNEAFIVQRYRNGLGSLDDLDSARTSLASARASQEANHQALAEARRSLQRLLGQSEPVPVPAAEYPEVLLPLADLPEQRLRLRPDLLAAYAAIEAADFTSRAAYNDLLPSLNLQAALSDVASNPRDALLTDPVWSLLANLTAPLFNGGQLRASAKIAELQAAESYQSYRDTLLTAVTEVGNALDLEQSLGRQQSYTESALASAHNTLKQYQNSYRSGLVSVLDLLLVQQTSYDLESELNNLIYQRLSNRITLGLALGLGVER